jgi:formate hydrogenlyase transcriptional activator
MGYAMIGFPNLGDFSRSSDVSVNDDPQVDLNAQMRPERCFRDIIGQSPAIQKVLEEVEIVASTNSTVLLHGETGTGKELIARAIHQLSSRRARSLVRMNCAAIPSGLLESELFGHEKGAFTGALIQKKGRFELADGGSLFLDEIGDISLELQPKLLRALQEQEFERLGSSRTIKVDARIIAATHRDLPQMVEDQKFREDLFYRLNVFPIYVPPLRERTKDIPLLVHYFVSTLSRKMGKSIRTIPGEAMRAMTLYPWPGNVRQLHNFIERSVILSPGEVLAAPLTELSRCRPLTPIEGSTLRGVERQAILEALRSAKGRLSGSRGAAELLGVKRTTLQGKMQRLRITRADYEFSGSRLAVQEN